MEHILLNMQFHVPFRHSFHLITNLPFLNSFTRVCAVMSIFTMSYYDKDMSLDTSFGDDGPYTCVSFGTLIPSLLDGARSYFMLFS